MTRLLRGYVEGEVRGAEPCAFLNRCAGLGLRFWDARPDGEHVLRVKLPLRDWDRAAAAAERCGCELPWEMPLLLQALICAAAITGTEFVAGIIINIVLGLNVWDYSALWGNVYGQICPQYSALWYLLSLVMIPALDWLRWCVEGGERPHYS